MIAILFFAIHVPLALVLKYVPYASSAHAALVLLVGMAFAMQGKVERCACAAAYVVGSEVLWRATGVAIFYEFGKYAVTLLMIMVFLARSNRSFNLAACFYFLFLLPSTIWTFTETSDLRQVQRMLSGQLSGPLCVMACWLAFSKVPIALSELLNILRSTLAPILCLASLCTFSTISTSDISFNTESNFVTSGGWGPNQVSISLGLGAMCAFLVLLLGNDRRLGKIVLLIAVIGLSTTCLLTFSRSGMAAAVMATAFAAPFIVRDSRKSILLVASLVAIYALFTTIVIPFLDDFTSGNFTRRFTDTDLTGRDSLMWAELQVWLNNPVLGVGPGMAKRYKTEAMFAGTHSEVTRMLAEHGLFGLAALVLLLSRLVANILRARGAEARFLTTTLAMWSILIMTSNGMRNASAGFFFGLSCLTITSVVAASPPSRPKASFPPPQPREPPRPGRTPPQIVSSSPGLPRRESNPPAPLG